MSQSERIFAVAAIFKNEAHVLEEWIDHYRKEGASSFILCDDGSDDDSRAVILGLADGLDITVISVPRGIEDSSQGWFLRRLEGLSKNLCEEWLLVCDLDEFVYCRAYPEFSIMQALSEIPDGSASAIGIPWILFGSNGHLENPPSVIQAYVKRLDYDSVVSWHADNREHYYGTPAMKYFVRTRRIKQLFVHAVVVTHGYIWSGYGATNCPAQLSEGSIDKFIFVANHYQFQSRIFWTDIKCCRGDVANWNLGSFSRTIETYDVGNVYSNSIIDLKLSLRVLDRHDRTGLT